MENIFKTMLVLSAMTLAILPVNAETFMSSNSLIYDNSTVPLNYFVNPDVKSIKAGSSTCTTYLMMYNTGDCGIARAMINNDIVRVHHIDKEIKSYLGGLLYRKVTLWVYGERQKNAY